MQRRWTDSGPSALFTEDQFAAIGEDSDPHWSTVWVAAGSGRVDDVPTPTPLELQQPEPVSQPESKVVDLMEALLQSVTDARRARATSPERAIGPETAAS